MIDGHKPYPAMKDSGVDWLGEVPEHWILAPNRSMLRRRKVLVGNRYTNYNLLSLTKSGVVIRDVSTGRGKFSADMGTSQEVRSGDLVFCLFDVPETPRTIGLSRHNGMITGAYSVFECDDRLLGRFLETFYIAMDDRKALSPLYSGLRNTIPPSRLLGIKTPIPPEDERAAIVRFLDHVDRRIRRYIRAKQELIALLEEQKQAMIHQAVTGQIDVRTGKPHPAYKGSGVEWVGEVPSHWTILPGRACYWEKKVPNKGLAETTVLSLSYGQIVVRPPEKLHGLVPASFETYQIVEPGDIIVRPTDLQNDRNSLRFGMSCNRGIITSAYMCLCTEEAVTRPYGHLLLHTYDLKKVFYGLGSGLRQNLDWSDFKYLPCIVPPFQEQTAIVCYLDKATRDTDSAINRARRQIDLLRDYRTRLIADVVTGKLDVRNAVAALPEVDPLAEEDVDDTIDAKVDSNLEKSDTVREVTL